MRAEGGGASSLTVDREWEVEEGAEKEEESDWSAVCSRGFEGELISKPL